jgi:glucan phosphoethanolaminetransferase (alkaline phosphatase superfamily)
MPILTIIYTSILAFYILIQIISVWIAIKLRRLPGIRHRSLSITLSVIVTSVILISNWYFAATFIEYPCSIPMFVDVIVLPIHAVLWIGRMYRLVSLYYQNEQELLRYSSQEGALCKQTLAVSRQNTDRLDSRFSYVSQEEQAHYASNIGMLPHRYSQCSIQETDKQYKCNEAAASSM